MKQTYYFIRSAKYNYLQNGKDLYESFDAVARRKIDPPISDTEETRKILSSKIPQNIPIFCSETKRSKETASLISGNIQATPFLNEIGYSMNNFITAKDFFDTNGNPNVTKARKQFVRALIHNRLGESFDSVVQRIQEILTLGELNSNENICFVSHGFLLKVIESLIHDPSIIKFPEKLLLSFSGDTETYSFTNGFVLENNQGMISFIRHL